MEDLTPHQNKNQNSTYGINAIYQTDTRYDNNYIHPSAIVGQNVKLGKNNIIGAFVVIQGNTKIGDNNTFEPFCSIGNSPEHKNFFKHKNLKTIIGDNNIFRENVTINSGTEKPTTIQDDVIVLRGSYIGHDSFISNNCTISCNVLIGGHSFIGVGANMGMGSICHQFSKIGSYSMIGMGTIITKKSSINCFGTYVGNPAKYLKENDYKKKEFNYKQVLDVCRFFEETTFTYFEKI
jgi:UDP-N-acetylglucosamine acyltransferase